MKKRQTSNSKEHYHARDRSPLYAHAKNTSTHEHLKAIASSIKAKARAQQQESTPHERPLYNERHTTKASEGENDADQEDGRCNDEPDTTHNYFTHTQHTGENEVTPTKHDTTP